MTDQHKKYKEIACAYAVYWYQYPPETSNENIYEKWLLTEEGKRLTAEDGEIEGLRAWKESMTKLWDPVISYAQNNKLPGLVLGQNISEYVLQQLKILAAEPEKETSHDLLLKISKQLDRLEGRLTVSSDDIKNVHHCITNRKE